MIMLNKLNTNRFKAKGIFLILCWALYDLANQFFAINVVSVYFPRWLILEKGVPEIFYSVSFGLSMIIVGICAPFLGIISDLQQKKKIYLTVFTLISVVFTFLMGLCNNVFLALFCFAFANFGCQISIVFYNALMVNVAEKKHLGVVSGVGRMLAYGGAILAMSLSKPLIIHHGYQVTFFVTAIAFLFFALPAMIFIPEHPSLEQKGLISFLRKKELNRIFLRIKSSFTKESQFEWLPRFLKVFFFGLCAVQTVILFMSVYAAKAFHLSETEIIDLIIFSTLFAMIGSLASGWISDKIGYKKAMIGVFVMWFFSFIGGAFLSSPFHWFLGAVIGFALSSTWVIARAWTIKLVPEENVGEVFGLFNLVGYAAGVIGPLFWGFLLLCLSPFKEWGYRLSFLGLGLFIVLSFIHVLKLPDTD